MSATYTNSMFDEIKTALAKTNNQGNTKYRDILKLEVGNIYTVRLVPNIEDPSKTFFRYFSHAWESFSTGQYLSNVSPQTWGEKDPISEAKYSLLKHGSDEEKEKAAKIMRRENWLANVFVVNDPTNPDNNGKVKLLRFGKQIHKIIMEAIEGDDSDEFGAKIFDMSPNGCSFKIKVERQGDEHFYCKDTSTDSVWNSEGGTTPAPTAASPPSTPSTPSTDSIDPLNDDKVKQLLDGLGD